ncbi:MAG: hypothetical protein M0Z60_15465 [Nitrospiraceae bacterium]|nr:hypothetical protein [Nitrospiraceae bacterium]
MRGKKKNGIEKKLLAYAATAVGALAMAPAAEAAVQYSGPKDIPLTPNGPPVMVDLNNDGADDFGFVAYSTQTTAGTAIYLDVQASLFAPVSTGGLGGTGVIGGAGSVIPIFTPARLGTGYQVGNTLLNYSWGNAMGALGFDIRYRLGTSSISYSGGNFLDATGCIGVRFQTAGGQRYGWIRYQGTSAPSVIKDWAYEDSGAPISACDVPPPVSVPALDHWGLMILIALLAGMSVKGIAAEKRKRNA